MISKTVSLLFYNFSDCTASFRTEKMLWTVVLVLSSLGFCITYGQLTCSNGVLVYEKSSATTVRSEARADRTIEISETEVPTSSCQRVCDGTPSCTAYSVDYTTKTCKTYSGTIVKSRLIPKSDAAFFQKICLPNTPRDFIRLKCGNRLWVIERVRGVGFQGAIAKVDQNVASREMCVRSCLTETSFECASAIYDESSRTCSLSFEDRRIRPTGIVENLKISDYIENQCLSVVRSCQYLRQNNVLVVSIDYASSVNSEEQCQQECTMNRDIICRSYSFDLQRNSCELSSDDTISLQGIELIKENGRRYGERRCSIQQNSINPHFNSAQLFQQVPNPFIQMPVNYPFGPSVSPNVGFPTQGGFFPQGNSRFDQFETQDPRFIFNNVNQRPGVLSTSGFGGYNPYQSQNRCFLEKSTGLSVIADAQAIIPTNGFFTRGVTSICSSWCKLQGPYTCPAFTVDYNNNRCTVLARPADVALRPGMTNGQSYLEHVCFNDYYRGCEGKSWAFERVINIELQGFDDRVLNSVRTRKDCEEACLRESRFLCLSAEYDSSRNECRLSRESRTTRPYSIQQAGNTDYLENHCIPPNTLSNCIPQRQVGFTLLYADAALTQIYSEDECRRACLTFHNFTCNAASYRQIAQECLLSTEAAVVTLPDSILLYTSCVQLNQVAPQSGQVPNFTPGNTLNPQFQNPNSNFYPGNQFLNPGFNPNSLQPSSGLNPTTSNFPNNNGFPNNFGNSAAGFPQSPSLFNQQFPNSGNQFPASGNQFPNSGQQFPNTGQFSGNSIPNSGQFPSSGQFPVLGNQFPNSGQFPTTGQFPGSGTQFSNTGIFPGSGNQFPSTGQFPSSGQFPSTGQFPSSGNQFPYSGQQFPNTEQFPNTGQFPILTNQLPNSGQFPVSGQQFPNSGQFLPGQSTGISATFPNSFGAQRPFTMNSPFIRPEFQSPNLQRPFIMNNLNRDFLLQHQPTIIPLLVPGRSTTAGSSNSSISESQVESVEEFNPSAVDSRRKKSNRGVHITDTQPK